MRASDLVEEMASFCKRQRRRGVSWNYFVKYQLSPTVLDSQIILSVSESSFPASTPTTEQPTGGLDGAHARKGTEPHAETAKRNLNCALFPILNPEP